MPLFPVTRTCTGEAVSSEFRKLRPSNFMPSCDMHAVSRAAWLPAAPAAWRCWGSGGACSVVGRHQQIARWDVAGNALALIRIWQNAKPIRAASPILPNRRRCNQLLKPACLCAMVGWAGPLPEHRASGTRTTGLAVRAGAAFSA